ncbi:hypothetical protein RBSH_04326 [Rhodopirellula baltica SH28]|uniref:Uncharacterized protein n=1 Tax=Rhodopirellula baltica SH28 TaxID=993517 RepID=K5D1I9_RHOBT|nr:hypothetical protein RBSH_04326 [Rhodopirellula baltica SH28]
MCTAIDRVENARIEHILGRRFATSVTCKPRSPVVHARSIRVLV